MAINFLKSILRVIVKTLFRVRVNSIDLSQYQNDKKIVIANHQSFLDGILIGLFIPLDMVFVINTEIAANFWVRQLLRLVDYFTVDPANPIAIKHVIKEVNSGKTLVIFPEGRITVTGSLMKVFEGSAFIAAKTEALIIPVSIKGLTLSYFSRVQDMYPTKLFPQITLGIHKPTTLSLPYNLDHHAQRKYAAKKIKKLMQNILFEAEERTTIYQAFLETTKIHGKSKRVLEDKDFFEYSYNDILKRSIGISKIISKISKEEEIIGILLPNVLITVASILGFNIVNRVPAMLNFTVGLDGINSACKVADIKTIITSKKFIETAKLDFVDKLNARVLYLEDLKEIISFGDKLSIFYAMMFPDKIEQNPINTKIAYVLFTSGSEGTPKGVALSQDNILANIIQVRSIIDINPNDKFFNALPMFHSFGLTGGTILPLLSGSRVFLYPSPLHNRVIPQIVYDRNCTILFGTSTFLNNYAKFADEYDFRSVRYVIAGAEKLSEDVKYTWFKKFGIRIFEGYGTTELSPVVSVNTPMAFKDGSVGSLLPCIEYKLQKVDGIDEGGQLFVKGPNVMVGYFKDDNLGVLQPPCDGWYDTGDIVEIDEFEFITIKGRLKRFAKIAAEMVSLEKVELFGKFIGKTCYAVNLPDAAKGEMVVVFSTDEITREELINVAQEQGLPLIFVPKYILKLIEVPMLGTGKTDYVMLKKIAMQMINQ